MILITIEQQAPIKMPGNGFELQMRGPGTAATQGALLTQKVYKDFQKSPSQLSFNSPGALQHRSYRNKHRGFG